VYDTDLESAVWTKVDSHATSIFEKNPEDQQAAIKQQYIDGMGGTEWFTERLQSVLKEHRWVFPGNGTFSFSDPCFNVNGDLLCALAYDGYVLQVCMSSVLVNYGLMDSTVDSRSRLSHRASVPRHLSQWLKRHLPLHSIVPSNAKKKRGGMRKEMEPSSTV